MTTEYSAKDEAHKIESLAKAMTSPYDANKGCTSAENQLVAELQMLQKDPAKENAVQRRLLLDDLIPNDFPVLRISHELKDQLKLHINNGVGADTSLATVDSTGYIVSTNDLIIAAGNRKWVLDNFDKLDTNKDGKVSDLELQGKTLPSNGVYDIPRLAGTVIGTMSSETMGYGFRMSNIGSIGSMSYGFGVGKDNKPVYGVTKAQLTYLIHQNDNQVCNK